MTELARRANDWHQTTGLPINPNFKENPMTDQNARQMLHDRVEHDITNHPPVGPHVTAAFETVAATVKQYMHTVVDVVPAGREQSMALTFAEQSIQMARAGIARNQDQVPEAPDRIPVGQEPLYMAWTIIANVDWPQQSPAWRAAASKWGFDNGFRETAEPSGVTLTINVDPVADVAGAMRAAGWTENMIGAAMDARYAGQAMDDAAAKADATDLEENR